MDESGEEEEDSDWDWDDAMGKLTKRNPLSAGRNPQVCSRNVWLEGANLLLLLSEFLDGLRFRS